MLSSLDMRDGMQLFLCAVILFGAYCAALGVISGRIQNRSGIVPAAMILLCIFWLCRRYAVFCVPGHWRKQHCAFYASCAVVSFDLRRRTVVYHAEYKDLK